MGRGAGHSPKGRDILRQAPEMKYVFIEKHQAEFSIKAMCRVLQVARSGWYAWRQRRHQINRRQQFRLVCDDAARQTFAKAKQRYGAPRLADELPEYNIKTIAASLRRQGLRAKASRRFSPVSYREHGLPKSENLLKQDFTPAARIRSGWVTSCICAPVKAGCIWRW